MAVIIEQPGANQALKAAHARSLVREMTSRLWWLWVAYLVVIALFAVFGSSIAPTIRSSRS